MIFFNFCIPSNSHTKNIPKLVGAVTLGRDKETVSDYKENKHLLSFAETFS